MNVDILFLGAGASTPFGIPTMKGMVTEFERTLEPSPERQLYELIRDKLRNYKYFDLESLITVLQNISAPEIVVNDVLNDPSIHFYSDWKGAKDSVDFVSKNYQDEARSLLRQLKEYLRKACTIWPKEEDFKLYDRLFTPILTDRVGDFPAYIKRKGPKDIQLSVFTTNYDLILEAYCSSQDIVCINGEKDRNVCISTDENSTLFGFPGPGTFRIRKLHGSINWYRDQKGKLRCSDRPVKLGEKSVYGDEIVEELLLYPIRGLYAYREPFYDLFSDLKKALEKACNCLVIGYSFRDKDIAGLFIDAAERNPSLTVCLVGLGSNTVGEVAKERLTGFKGTLAATTAKFNHENIEELLTFLQNPADSEVITKSLSRIIGGG